MAYSTEISFPRHQASLSALQAYFSDLCQNLGVPEKIRDQVALALEEGLSNFFKHTIPSGDETPLRLRIRFSDEAIQLKARAAGRPFDFSKIPKYRLPQSIEDTPEGLGTFLIEKLMDSVTWRYLEKEGQEFEMQKKLPAPIALHRGASIPAAAEDTRRDHGEIAYRRLSTREEALALASAAWDIYGYGYKDVIYYPDQVVEQSQSGKLLSWIAVNQNNRVVGHYAMMRYAPDAPLGEMGAAFVLPELRKAGVFRELAERIHAEAEKSSAHALFSLSVTNHVATQKASEAMGRLSVALHLASTPAIFVEGAKPGERITTVLNFRQLKPRANRVIYPPPRHRDMILQSYDWLGLTISDGAGKTQEADTGEDRLEYQRDLAWNRAKITAAGGEAVRYKLAAFTEFLVAQQVACIMLAIDLENSSAPALCDAAEALGFFYSGIFPESGQNGHDVLELQFLNGVVLDPAEIKLHQPSAKSIMDYIRRQGATCFAAK